MGGLFEDHMLAGHAIAGAGAVAAATSLAHPLDTLKTLLQVAAGRKQQLRLPEVVERIGVASGTAGLYSGLGWATLAKVSGLGARFGTYEILIAFFKDGRLDGRVYYSEAMMGGIAAGAVEAVMCTPFELLKLREQLSSASHLKAQNFAVQEMTPASAKLLPSYSADTKAFNNAARLLSTLSPKYPDFLGALKQYPWMLTGSGRPPLASCVVGPYSVTMLEGWPTFWKGLRSGIARDSVFGGIFFTMWQFIHDAMLIWKSIDMKPPPRSLEEVGLVSPLASSLAAGFSGVVAAAASHSFDTAKSRSECVVVPKYIRMERKLLKWKTSGTWLERATGMSPADRSLMFRGIWLRMARSGIASFALVGSYFLAVDNLF